jgi:hypothetical protein
MGCSVKIDIERRLVTSSFSGRIDDKELLRLRSLVLAQPDFDSTFSEIVDFTEATGGDVSEAALMKHAGQTIYQVTSKHVFVCPDDFWFGMARMFQVHTERARPNFAVVRSLKEAYKELGLKFP